MYRRVVEPNNRHLAVVLRGYARVLTMNGRPAEAAVNRVAREAAGLAGQPFSAYLRQ